MRLAPLGHDLPSRDHPDNRIDHIPALAKTAKICDLAAHRAAQEVGVPFPVLWSITRTETGRVMKGKLAPWPWTVNMEGEGHWFNTMEAAREFAFQHFERGARSFDIGCFQINYKWHGESFRSIDQMFDPYENARYAAAFLARLYRESGNWSEAAGTYHSRTPEYATVYRSRFDKIRLRYGREPQMTPAMSSGNGARVVEPLAAQKNSYPLLKRSGANLGKGSLVPLSHNQTRSFIVFPGRAEGS